MPAICNAVQDTPALINFLLFTFEMMNLPLIDQREIEARIVGPLIRAFAAEFGETRTLEIVRDLIHALARQGGSELRGPSETKRSRHSLEGSTAGAKTDRSRSTCSNSHRRGFPST